MPGPKSPRVFLISQYLRLESGRTLLRIREALDLGKEEIKEAVIDNKSLRGAIFKARRLRVEGEPNDKVQQRA